MLVQNCHKAQGKARQWEGHILLTGAGESSGGLPEQVCPVLRQGAMVWGGWNGMVGVVYQAWERGRMCWIQSPFLGMIHLHIAGTGPRWLIAAAGAYAEAQEQMTPYSKEISISKNSSARCIVAHADAAALQIGDLGRIRLLNALYWFFFKKKIMCNFVASLHCFMPCIDLV